MLQGLKPFEEQSLFRDPDVVSCYLRPVGIIRHSVLNGMELSISKKPHLIIILYYMRSLQIMKEFGSLT